MLAFLNHLKPKIFCRPTVVADIERPPFSKSLDLLLEKVTQECPEQMQYIWKQDKTNQAERIWESKYKTTVIEIEGLKDKYKQMEKEKKNVERKCAIIKEAYGQTKTISEQTTTKLKHLHQEKETSEEVIKALKSMEKTKIDSVPNK